MPPPLIDRVQRLKDARTEAEREIEEYKQAKEAEFKAFEASVRRFTFVSSKAMLNYPTTQHAGNTSSVQVAIDRETEIKLQAITESYHKNKDVVVKNLLGRVVLVEPVLHRNLKKVSD